MSGLIELTEKQYLKLVDKCLTRFYESATSFTKYSITELIRNTIGSTFYVSHEHVKTAFNELLKADFRDKFTMYDNGVYCLYKKSSGLNDPNIVKKTCTTGNTVISIQPLKTEYDYIGKCKLNKAGLNLPRELVRKYKPISVMVLNRYVTAKPDSRGDIRLSRNLLNRLGITEDNVQIKVKKSEVTKEYTFLIY